MKQLLIAILTPLLLQAQCACTWKTADGVIHCQLYSNCSNPNLTACASKPAATTLCPCQQWPGMNWNCGGCLPNGACWYNGSSCLADQVCGLIALPVELMYLIATKTSEGNSIDWATASENGSAYFTIEHSVDGSEFKYLGQVTASGESQSEVKYSVLHSDPEAGINYYRLTQVDMDGKQKVYDLISVDNSVKEKVVTSRVNMYGQEVDASYIGLKICTYSDGSVSKLF